MPDGQQVSVEWLEASQNPPPSYAPPPSYVPPVALVLAGLDTNELELNKQRVSVCASFLRFLIGELARTMPFDPPFYASAYPDVEAARLAGDVATLHEHFADQGYFERRQPYDLPFDPAYYVSQYNDLAQVFDPRDAVTLRSHFVNHGWQEGRAGVSWQRADAERWVVAARVGTEVA